MQLGTNAAIYINIICIQKEGRKNSSLPEQNGRASMSSLVRHIAKLKVQAGFVLLHLTYT